MRSAKSTRLSYNRFTEALAEHGLVDAATLNHVLQQCIATGALLPEILVKDELASDWEVARVACELFAVPFLPIDVYPPAQGALEGIDPDFLRQYGLVPIDRFGSVLTVAMPGMVPMEVLDSLSRSLGEVQVLPVVSTVRANRQWLDEHLPEADLGAKMSAALGSMEERIEEVLPGLDEPAAALPVPSDDSWERMFDLGEQAVQLDLDGTDLDEEFGREIDEA